MTSCFSLQRFRPKVITVQEIIDSGPSWVCHGLQKLTILIDMGFQRGPSHCRKFMEQELDQCRAMYKQLGTLKSLRVLDTLVRDKRSRSIFYPHLEPTISRYQVVPPPLRLKAGLDQLSQLKGLKRLSFWIWRHATYKKEVVWMLDHWKHLEELQGGWLGKEKNSKDQNDYLFYSEQLERLVTQRDVSTYGPQWDRHSWKHEYDVDVEDCCGEDE